jgi:hypothetical protein
VKKKKSIVINNPQLNKIRNNLRILLIRWANNEWDKLKEKERKISYNINGRVRHPNSYSVEEKSELHRFRSEIIKNTEMVDKSICKCFRCVATDKNMTYNPVEKAWFCFQCYEEMKRWTMKKKTGISVRFP